MQPEVQIAKALHVNDLISFVREAHTEESTLPLRVDDNAVFELILRSLRGEAVIGLIANDEEIESACFLEVAKPWYSNTPIVLCDLFYTRPEYRKSANSKELLLWARHQAERLNCPLHIDAPTVDSAKPKVALFTRVLGAPGGIGFVHEPHPEQPESLAPVKVELATPDDEAQVFDVVRELGKENAAYTPDEEAAISVVRPALYGTGLIGLIRQDKEIGGIIFLRLMKPWFSSQPFLDEWLAFVPARFRKSQNAKALIQFAKRQSDRLELPLRIGIVSKVELSRKLDLYERLLGSPRITSYLYRPN